jgi:hypothetical protein
MTRTVAKELHAVPVSDHKYELTKGTTTMKHQPQHQPQRQKKGLQQWVLAICVAAFVVFILSRNQDSQDFMLQIDAELVTEQSVRPKIRQISILGERNSGTRWTFEYVPIKHFLATREAVDPLLLSRRRTYIYCRNAQTHLAPIRTLQSYFRLFRPFFKS